MMTTRVARGQRTALGLSLVAGAATLLGACASTTGASGAAASRSSSSTQDAPPPPPALSITPTDGSRGIRLDQPVTISADRGTLDSVVLHSDADPTPITGSLSPDHRTWTVTGSLDPNSHYSVEANAHDEGGASSARAAFGTMPQPRKLLTDISPEDTSTVGVGMPIMLSFHSDVAPDRQAAVLQHITVQTSVPVEGNWHWFSPSEVHWRPKDFWPAATKVTILGNLRDVDAGNGYWGLGNWSSSFVVGEKHVSIIDAAAHQMQVFQNDVPIKSYPVSTGRPDRPTLSGTLIVRGKVQKVHMDSQTIGIPRNSPDGYYEDVFWDTAISVNGFYIHGAPWSVYAQGNTNVSHGCVNLSTDRAIEFYNFSQTGDVVIVKNTSRVADYGDGEGDWQIPYEQWANSGGVTTAPAATAPGGA